MTFLKCLPVGAPRQPKTPVRVGRLVPLDGVTVREHPDREQLWQFLQELRFPLATMENLLEVVGDTPMSEPVRQALGSLADNTRFLADLVGDYHDYSKLEADSVAATAAVTSPLDWFESMLLHVRARAHAMGHVLFVDHRSFLPDAVEFDDELSAHAIEAVVRTACHRALPGPVRIVVAYECHAPGKERLLIDVETRGGGFTEIDQGYAFVPFALEDGSHRPVLGLSVAQRLFQLLGGSLDIASSGPAACIYRTALSAPMARGAMWIDPVSASREPLGCARPGTLVLADANDGARLLCEPMLRRLGFRLDVAADLDALLARIGGAAPASEVLLLTESVTGPDVAGCIGRLRAAGHDGVVLFAGAAGRGAAADATMPRRFTVREFGEALARARYRERHRDDKNATSAC